MQLCIKVTTVYSMFAKHLTTSHSALLVKKRRMTQDFTQNPGMFVFKCGVGLSSLIFNKVYFTVMIYGGVTTNMSHSCKR